MNSPLVWVEIDLKAIDHNVRELRRITNHNACLMAAVKANAYGHGLVDVSRQCLASGVKCLAVARLFEGVQLREAGITAPILVLGYTAAADADALIDYDLMQTVFSISNAAELSKAAVKRGQPITIHLKVDTGMGRFGLVWDSKARQDLKNARQVLQDIKTIACFPGLTLEGIFTHFASADSADKTSANEQFACFIDLLDRLTQEGLEIPVKHAANSAAVIDMPETHLNMVRAGIAIYGLYPSEEVHKARIALQPAMTFKSKIVQLKHVPAGFTVSYGCTYTTQQPTVIATVPVGYADGYSRILSSRSSMLIRGRRAPVVGRVCMDVTMVDVGHIPDVALEDEVVIFGRQGTEMIPVDEIAETLGTIHYEVVSSIMDRVTRIYL